MNTFLAALQPRDRARISECSEQVTLQHDAILAEAGQRVETVYFPTDSCIVVQAGIKPRSTIGIGLIGKEGMLGTSLALGIDTAPLGAKVACSGAALQMPVGELHRALLASPDLDQRLRRLLYLELRQMPLTAACAIFHVVDRRLAYWLLMLHDRASGDRIDLTHESLATMLGVRRSGVSTAAGILQRSRLIRYSRGHIIILDRNGLEAAACSCYRSEHVAIRRLAATSTHRPSSNAATLSTAAAPS